MQNSVISAAQICEKVRSMNSKTASEILKPLFEQCKGTNECLGYIEHFFSKAEEEALDFALKALEERPKGVWKCFIGSAYYGVDNDGEPIWRARKIYHCPECNRRTVIKENFCPTCGTDMREAATE